MNNAKAAVSLSLSCYHSVMCVTFFLLCCCYLTDYPLPLTPTSLSSVSLGSQVSICDVVKGAISVTYNYLNVNLKEKKNVNVNKNRMNEFANLLQNVLSGTSKVEKPF